MASENEKRNGGQAGPASRTNLLPLLSGTLAALHCRELVASGCMREARVELCILRAAIADLAARGLDEQANAELEHLRSSEERLAAVLADGPDPEDHSAPRSTSGLLAAAPSASSGSGE